MGKADDDRRHAQEALRQASVTKHDVDQTIWLRLAQTWLNLLPSGHSWRRKPVTTGISERIDQGESNSSRGKVLPFRRP